MCVTKRIITGLILFCCLGMIGACKVAETDYLLQYLAVSHSTIESFEEGFSERPNVEWQYGCQQEVSLDFVSRIRRVARTGKQIASFVNDSVLVRISFEGNDIAYINGWRMIDLKSDGIWEVNEFSARIIMVLIDGQLKEANCDFVISTE